MGLRSALVDRARTVRREKAGPRVMGTTPYAPTHGAWFKCRLELPFGPEDAAEAGLGGGRRKAVRRPQIMFDRVDEDGDPVELKFTDELDIDSAELGLTHWRLTANPRPIRKKRAIIGWEVTLERVEERQPLTDAVES